MKSEAPSLRVAVVALQHVGVRCPEGLPICHRLFDPYKFRDAMLEGLKEGGLATADIALDGEVESRPGIRLLEHPR